MAWQVIIFSCGLFTFKDLYNSMWEYNNGIADFSYLELILCGILIMLFERYFRRSKNLVDSFWHRIRQPFIFIGWFNFLSLIILYLTEIIGMDDEEYFHFHSLDLIVQLLIFLFFYTSILLATPKVFKSPWSSKTTQKVIE